MRDFTFRSTRTEEIPDFLEFFTPDNLKTFQTFKGRYRKSFEVTLCKLVFWPLNNGQPVTAYWNDLRSHFQPAYWNDLRSQFQPPKFTFHNKMSWEQQQQVDALKAYNRELSESSQNSRSLPVLEDNDILMDAVNEMLKSTKTATPVEVELFKEFENPADGGLSALKDYQDNVFQFEGTVKFFDGMNTHMELDVEQMTLYTYYITIHPTRKLFRPWRATYEGRSTKKTFYKAGAVEKHVEPVGKSVNGVFPQIQDTSGRDGTIEKTVKSMQRSEDKNIDLEPVKNQVKEYLSPKAVERRAQLAAEIEAMQQKKLEEMMQKPVPHNEPGSSAGSKVDSAMAAYFR